MNKRNDTPTRSHATFGVVDLFSGAGGMSYGFHKHPRFNILAAADAQIGKPSMGRGSLECNHTYQLNMGVEPVGLDLGQVEPSAIREKLGLGQKRVSVLSACAPCTGFSRANPLNHLRNDTRNTLVGRSGLFATALDVDILVMENARELLTGNFKDHFGNLKRHLEDHGYRVHAASHLLTRYGLPQIRERAIVMAVKKHLRIRTLEDLWQGWEPTRESTSVRHAFNSIRPDATLQGFPNDFEFNGSSLSNNYRHIGDAVPPLISHQIAWACDWMLTGEPPVPGQWILPDSPLSADGLTATHQPKLKYG